MSYSIGENVGKFMNVITKSIAISVVRTLINRNISKYSKNFV